MKTPRTTKRPNPANSIPEILESRIAPATFLVSATALTVAGNDAAAATVAGSDQAVLLKTGDQLIYDSDASGTVNAGDLTLVAVTGGQAMAFLTDITTFPGRGRTGAFDPFEVAGLAVSDGFKATINTDISGPITTSLKTTDTTFSAGNETNFDNASIAGLTVSGRVEGPLFAGNSIGNVSIGAAKFIDAGVSVADIRTGSATSGAPVNFNHGVAPAKTFFPTFTQGAGTNAGGVSNVFLQAGANNVIAGNGGDIATGTGAAGGDVTKFTIVNSTNALTIIAGDGGKTTTGGSGGKGGSINAADVATRGSNLDVQAGMGGKGSGTGDGGLGGSINGSSLKMLADGTTLNVGGDGGNISGVTIKANEYAQLIAAGDGGNGSTAAGKGGSITGVAVIGDIGNFSATFDTGSGFSKQGGLIAGQASRLGAAIANALNGSIANVTADRIATIVAGRILPAKVATATLDNAVFALSGIVASVIGADTRIAGTGFLLNPVGRFDFTDNTASPTTFDATNEAIDGVVIVRAADLAPLPVTPLFSKSL